MRRRPGTAVLRAAVVAYRRIPRRRPPSCRFDPTCSAYALTALERYGVWRGTGLTLRRLSRCHPWGGSGYDPVPVPAEPAPGGIA